MSKHIHMPKGNKWKGISIWCDFCRTSVNQFCLEDTPHKPIEKCKHKSDWRYKCTVHVPGTTNTRKTKILEARNYEDAVRESIEFRKSVLTTNLPIHENQIKEIKEEERNQSIPLLFLHAVAKYIAWLSGEGILKHHPKRQRTDAHIKDIERTIALFITTMQENQINMRTIQMSQIKDEMVGIFHEKVLEKLQRSDRTYNKYMGYMSSLLNWYSKSYRVSIPNYFEIAERKKTIHEPKSISPERFEKFISSIHEEDGVKTYKQGKKLKRNMYTPWLADGCKLGLETGCRREELVQMKFSDVIEYEDGTMNIRVENLKVNRIQNRSHESEKKYSYIPVTTSLRDLLEALGYDHFRRTDTYILAPEIGKEQRRGMMDALSRGFGHYYNLAFPGETLTFKSLRKTYITNLNLFMGNARAITGHSSDQVLTEHYLDKEVIARRIAAGFSVFPKDQQRNEELERTRMNSKKTVDKSKER